MRNNLFQPYILSVFIFVQPFFLSCSSPDFSKAGCARLKTGQGEIINLELAKTPHEHAFGLMFREFMPQNRGMLFIFPDDEARSFWMKNTMIPLDILFADSNLKIRKIFRNVPVPEDNENEASIPSVSSKAKYVVEINAGAAEKSGLKEGQKLDIEAIMPQQCSSIISEIN